MGSRRRNARRFVCIPCTDKAKGYAVVVRRIGKHSHHFHGGVVTAMEVK